MCLYTKCQKHPLVGYLQANGLGACEDFLLVFRRGSDWLVMQVGYGEAVPGCTI